MLLVVIIFNIKVMETDKSLPIKGYLNMIKPYLSGIINYYRTQGGWTIHFTIAIKFFSSKNFEKKIILCIVRVIT